jgi:signal transduction histidine kinase
MDQVTGGRSGILLEVVIASLLTVFAQLNLHYNIDQSVYYGPMFAVAAATAIATGVLAFRRRAPLATVCVVAAAIAGPEIFTRLTITLWGDFVPLLVAAYAVERWAWRQAAMIGAVIAVFAIAVLFARVPVIGTISNVPFTFVPLIDVIVVGRVLAHRHRTHAMARDRTRQLELDRDESIRSAIADERGRIARELHDIVAHCVSVMVVQAGAAEDLLERDPASALGPLRSVQETGRDAVGELQRMLGLLRAEGSALALKPQPGTGQLTDLAEQMNLIGLPVVLTIEGPARQLPPGTELTIYRIAQEALTNTLKHANAAKASVLLPYTDDSVELEVTDVGPGAPATGNGHGLIGMKERAALYGGTLSAGPRTSGGFGVRVELPMAVAAR